MPARCSPAQPNPQPPTSSASALKGRWGRHLTLGGVVERRKPRRDATRRGGSLGRDVDLVASRTVNNVRLRREICFNHVRRGRRPQRSPNLLQHTASKSSSITSATDNPSLTCCPHHQTGPALRTTAIFIAAWRRWPSTLILEFCQRARVSEVACIVIIEPFISNRRQVLILRGEVRSKNLSRSSPPWDSHLFSGRCLCIAVASAASVLSRRSKSPRCLISSTHHGSACPQTSPTIA